MRAASRTNARLVAVVIARKRSDHEKGTGRTTVISGVVSVPASGTPGPLVVPEAEKGGIVVVMRHHGMTQHDEIRQHQEKACYELVGLQEGTFSQSYFFFRKNQTLGLRFAGGIRGAGRR